MARFEAVFSAGADSHADEWYVIEYTFQKNGVRIGNVIWKTRDMEVGEHEAHEMAKIHQWEYDNQFANEFA